MSCSCVKYRQLPHLTNNNATQPWQIAGFPLRAAAIWQLSLLICHTIQMCCLYTGAWRFFVVYTGMLHMWHIYKSFGPTEAQRDNNCLLNSAIKSKSKQIHSIIKANISLQINKLKCKEH